MRRLEIVIAILLAVAIALIGWKITTGENRPLGRQYEQGQTK
jgi:hypothetical protein